MYVCFYCMYVYIVLVGKDEPIVKMLIEAEVQCRESKVDKLVATVVESAKQAEIERVASLRSMAAENGHNSNPSPAQPIPIVSTVTPIIDVEPLHEKGEHALIPITPTPLPVVLSQPISPNNTNTPTVSKNRRRRISNTNNSSDTGTVGTSNKGLMSSMSSPGEQTLSIEDIDDEQNGHNYDLRAASFVE